MIFVNIYYLSGRTDNTYIISPPVIRAGREVLSVLAEVEVEDPPAVSLQGRQQPCVRERVLRRRHLPTTCLSPSLRRRDLYRRRGANISIDSTSTVCRSQLVRYVNSFLQGYIIHVGLTKGMA